jgi:signal recognition particle GTPase
MLGMGDMSDFVEKVQDLQLDSNKNLMKNLESGTLFSSQLFLHASIM